MIVKGRALDQLLTRPGADLRAVLFYGPNEGRVREYAAQVAKSVVADLSDPFRVCQLSVADLKNDPARLADEAAAIAMTGGRRVVLVRGSGDAQTECFVNFFENPQGDALVVVEAGELAKTSKLRKLFETHTLCVIAACYEENAEDLDRLVTGHLRQHGLSINSDARAYLLDCLGDDRLAARQELDKLVLYKWSPRRADAGAGVGYVIDGKAIRDVVDGKDTAGIRDTHDVRDTVGFKDIGGVHDIPDIRDIHDLSGITDTPDIHDVSDVHDAHDTTDTTDTYDANDANDRCVRLEDVMACIGDSSVQGLDGVCDALGAGDVAALDQQLARAFDAAMAPVSVLRSASNHFLRLQLTAALRAQGASVDMAMRSLRPPIHFSRTQAFQQQLRIWDLPRIARALDLLLQGEAACKTTGAPDYSLCSQAMIQVAQLVVRRNA